MSPHLLSQICRHHLLSPIRRPPSSLFDPPPPSSLSDRRPPSSLSDFSRPHHLSLISAAPNVSLCYYPPPTLLRLHHLSIISDLDMVKRKSTENATPTAMTGGSSGFPGGGSVTESTTASKKCFLERWLTNDFPSDNKDGSTGGGSVAPTWLGNWLTPDFSCDDDEGFLRSQLTSPPMKSVPPAKPRWVAMVKKEGCGDSVAGGTTGSEKCWLERWLTNDFPSDKGEGSTGSGSVAPTWLGNWLTDDFSCDDEEDGFFRSQLTSPPMPPIKVRFVLALSCVIGFCIDEICVLNIVGGLCGYCWADMSCGCLWFRLMSNLIVGDVCAMLK